MSRVQITVRVYTWQVGLRTREQLSIRVLKYRHRRIPLTVFISQNFSTTLTLTFPLFYHRLDGRGPTGVTLLEVVILFTEFFRNVCGSDSVAVPNTFLVRAVVGFM